MLGVSKGGGVEMPIYNCSGVIKDLIKSEREMWELDRKGEPEFLYMEEDSPEVFEWMELEEYKEEEVKEPVEQICFNCEENGREIISLWRK